MGPASNERSAAVDSGSLDPECQRRIASTKRPEAVRRAMEELLIGLRSSFPGSEVVPGYEQWQVVELRRGGRVIVRVFPKNGLVKVENVTPGSKPGDYGPDLDMRQKDGEWAYKLTAGGASDELLLCVKDAAEGISEGRRRAGRIAIAGSRTAQVDTWRRSSIRPSLRFQVLLRDDYTCGYCGRSAPDVVLQVDHRTPVSLGGSDDIENLVTACVECNQGKGNRHVT
jgi:hypothetical protein